MLSKQSKVVDLKAGKKYRGDKDVLLKRRQACADSTLLIMRVFFLSQTLALHAGHRMLCP
jgi:hypothetical protein